MSETFTLKLTERELWFLAEGFTAAFTDPDERNEHEVSAAEKLDAAVAKARRDKADTRTCDHGIRHPWQCDDCDRENPMPEGWKP